MTIDGRQNKWKIDDRPGPGGPDIPELIHFQVHPIHLLILLIHLEHAHISTNHPKHSVDNTRDVRRDPHPAGNP
jgi:hypothetical protein